MSKKIKNLDCKTCDKSTTHIKISDMSNAETVFTSIFTFGVAAACREFWWKCSSCGNKIRIQ